MFEKLRSRLGGPSRPDPFEPHMPEIDAAVDPASLFARARTAAARSSADGSRELVIVTPSRTLMMQPCRTPGSMPPEQVEEIEKIVPSQPQRRIAAIANTDLQALRTDVDRAIPFASLLLAFAYIGHSVWVFEGHPSALAHGCRDAELLIVDDAMVSHLPRNWAATAAGVMRQPQIFLHDRAKFQLRRWKLPTTSGAPR